MTKIVTKNGYKFATGMFWQIPDEGKRALNFSKLVKDTKHNMFCHNIKTIKPTFGFCHKDELNGEKKVASLAKFIIDSSQLSSNYANSIICYKFMNAGEMGDDGRPIQDDLYGYIVLLNATICPEEGEYVSEFSAVKESIIEKATKHEIEVLFLPSDVSSKFFSIFEMLVDAYQNETLLLHLIQNLITEQRDILEKFISDTFPESNYINLLNGMHDTNTIQQLRKLIIEPAFEKMYKSVKERNLKFIINNIYTLDFTSDDIYWNNPKFKFNYKQALLKSIARYSNQRFKLVLVMFLFIFAAYLTYSTFIKEEILPEPVIVQAPPPPTPQAVNPVALIDKCLGSNDKFFKDLGTWTFNTLKCNSLGSTLSFGSDSDTTLTEFSKLVGSEKNLELNGRNASYKQNYQLLAKNVIAVNHLNTDQITSQLQQSSIDHNFKLALSNPAGNMHKFSISSVLSPVFLLNHHVLDNVLISDISMNFNINDGFYTWTLEGEYK